MKNPLPLMKNRLALAVHRYRGLDGDAAEDLVQGLVSQTDSQDGNLPVKMGDGRFADARLVRGLGTRRDAEPVGLKFRNTIKADFVVAKNQDLQVELIEELHQVVGKGVVIVDHHQAHQPPSSYEIPCRGGPACPPSEAYKTT